MRQLLEASSETQVEFLRQAAKEHFYVFCKFFIGLKDINPRTHGDMIACLQKCPRRALIVMPRGTFKSSIGSVAYPIWRLIRNPDIRILIDSEIYKNSTKFLREIKAHLENPFFEACFGKHKTDWNWNEGEITIATRKVIKKEPTITCSGVGAIKVGMHYDLIIMDDMNSQKNSDTPEKRLKVVEHYQYATSLLEPDGDLNIIGTRYAADDLIGHVLENEVSNGSDDTRRVSGKAENPGLL